MVHNYKYNNHDIVRYNHNVPLPPFQSLCYLPNRKSLCSLAVFLVLFLNLCLFSQKKKKKKDTKRKNREDEHNIASSLLVREDHNNNNVSGSRYTAANTGSAATAAVVFAASIAVSGSFVFGAAVSIIIILVI